MPQFDIFNNWYVLKNDRTLSRACKKENISDPSLYQKHQLDTALKYCKNFRTAIDIGANYGVVTYNLSSIFNNVYSYEIQPEVFKCLDLNIEKFSLKNVKAYPFGIGEKEQHVELNFNREATFSTHIDVCQPVGNCLVKPLDALNLSNVDFIKIDAEGYEPLIAKGALSTIEKYMPVILFESKGHEARYGFTRHDFLEILKPFGYRYLENIGKKNSIVGVV